MKLWMGQRNNKRETLKEESEREREQKEKREK